MSGKNKCQDIVHKKTCWTFEEWESLKAILTRYIGVQNDARGVV